MLILRCPGNLGEARFLDIFMASYMLYKHHKTNLQQHKSTTSPSIYSQEFQYLTKSKWLEPDYDEYVGWS